MKKRLALIGCGYLSQIIAGAVKKGFLPDYELVAVLGRDPIKATQFSEHFNCKMCTKLNDVLALEPEYVVEAASPQAVIDYTEEILKNNSNVIILSASALSDDKLYQRIIRSASDNNTKLYIAGGATGGFNLLQTALFMSSAKMDVTITSKKSPRFVSHMPFNKINLMGLSKKERVYTGTAKDIINIYPYVFNVVYATSLASVGPENTKFNIDAVPNFTGDEYNIEVNGELISLDLTINSRDYAISAWSVVSILKNITSPVVFM